MKVFCCRYLSLGADDEDACSRFDDIVDDGVELVEAEGIPGGVRYAEITERLHLAIKSIGKRRQRGLNKVSRDIGCRESRTGRLVGHVCRQGDLGRAPTA